ncbi:MAG TPA: DUF1918 domain-containing protein [Jatrophihabitans sp.]|nr:DUF1918 domain-containing protein [Jatrophihabitans sp.]
MFARVGDWLVIESRSDGTHARRGEIVEVAHADGSPPYRVRWNDEHVALVFPGPDAHVLSGGQQVSLEASHLG